MQVVKKPAGNISQACLDIRDITFCKVWSF